MTRYSSILLALVVVFVETSCQRMVDDQDARARANVVQDAGESVDGGRMDALAVPTPPTGASASGSSSPQAEPRASASAPQVDPYHRRVVSHDGRLVAVSAYDDVAGKS